MGRLADQVGGFGDLPVYVPQRLDECVQRLFGFRFGGLNHQGFVDDQWEVHGGGVEAVVQKPFGYLQPAGAPSLLPIGGEDGLVHAAAVVGQEIYVFQGLHQVVGVQYGVAADGPDPRLTQGADIRVGAHEHAKITVESAELADGLCGCNQDV